ncbi:MAG TPA: tRNA uridine-5-carboxymethylaminomethyl(34) synthesis GTPase MnmE [Syntrophomonadaceae bacterium]|nr:tRNA uridine-5-carboxymethylaminomethyl(34) synthesis GTPase MnmE [Syntrophomonadaceae bacterium]
MYRDDIVALSTPPGESGVGIVRMSGPDVIQKAAQIFQPYNPETDITKKAGYTLTLGWILDAHGEAVDEVLLTVMRAPRSYTGEDVVEINCHGGLLPIERCLQRCMDAGARIAEPGEFTRRAFLNGRLSLDQAEAVIDIIRARSDRGLKLAMQQLQGKLSEYLEKLEERLIYANALVEASIDFPDEVGDPDYEELRQVLQESQESVERFLAAGERGELYRQGIKLAICGKPNVGKSSLLNLLIGKDKAIVTDIPGTTRDVIDEIITIRGIPVQIMDTAGIRETEDLVEKIGVRRSRETIEQADVVIFLLDVSTGITEEDREIYASIDQERLIVLVNKEDLEDKEISAQELEENFGLLRVIRGSVKEETGLDELEQCIEAMVLEKSGSDEGMEIMTTLRQKEALLRSRDFIVSALQSLEQVPLECLSVDIHGAVEALGEITGKSFHEEVLDRIFQEFCIGK